MANTAFKVTSKRGNLSSSNPPKLPNTCHSNSTQKSAPPSTPVRKRSLSVSAISRSKQSLDISTDFSNKRENPLFWTSVSSPTHKDGSNENFATVTENQREKIAVESTTEKGSGKTAATDQRGRSVTRNSGVKNGIGRSISRVRGRSVSRGHYQSEKEQEVAALSTSRNSDLKQVIHNVKNDNIVRDRADIRGHTRNSKTINSQSEATEFSEDDSACSFQISNWEDGISTCSLSEAEEKTIKAVCEQMKSFRADQWGADSSASGIYETVRSEVRRAITDIQNDLESVIRRNNAHAVATSSVPDIPSDLVDTGPVEFVMDIRREYAQKLGESEERARKLRADLAVEEHRGKELSRILQEILPDLKTSNPQKSRMGRKRSTERKKISRCLREEAMAYFDECVSISTLDSSDFSAPEDPPNGLAGSANLVGGSVSVPGGILSKNLSLDALDSYSNNKQAIDHGHDLHASYVPAVDQVDQRGNNSGNSELHQFSFAQKPKENLKSHDIKSYIKHFERGATGSNVVIAAGKISEHDTAEHDLQGRVDKLLFDRVFSRNRIESGGLHLCAGIFTVSFSPFGSVV